MSKYRFFTATVAAILLMIAGCARSPEATSEVRGANTPAGVPRVRTWKITPKETAVWVFRGGGVPVSYPAEASSETARFVAAPGDIIVVGWGSKYGKKAIAGELDGSACLYLDSMDGDTCALSVDEKTRLVRQNGNAIGFLDPSHSESLPWSAEQRACMEGLTKGELSTFRFFGGEVTEIPANVQRVFAQRLADARPPRLLFASSNGRSGWPAGTSIDPIAFVGNSAEALSQFGGGHLESVILTRRVENGDLAQLTKFPHLRKLGLWETKGMVQLPFGLSLDGVMLGDSDGLSGLEQQRALVQLVAPAKWLKQFDLRRTFPKLASLTTNVSELPTIPSGLWHLSIVGDEGLTPELLAAVARANPDLASIEFCRCKTIASLSPLKDMASLRSVVLVKTDVGDTRSLADLKGVGFFGVDDGIEELKTRRPEAVVVRVDGLCLGSGWLLVLAPVIVVGGLLARKRGMERGEVAA